jgi:hypothetical protein
LAGLAFALQTGLSLEFSKAWRMDLSVIVSPFNMELAPNLSMRFQK